MARRTAIDDYGNIMEWDDGDDAGGDWSRGDATNDESADDFSDFDRQATERQQQTDIDAANRQLGGDPILAGGNASGGSSGGLPAESSFLDAAAKALGISKADLLKRGAGALLKGAGGAGLGYLLGERAKKQVAASKVPAGGIQSFAPYTPKVRTAADYTGRVPAWVSQAGVGLAPQPGAQPGMLPGAQPGPKPGPMPGQPSSLPYGGNAIPAAPGGGGIAEYGPQRPNRPEDRAVLRDWLESYHRTKGGGAPMMGLGGMDVLTGGASGYPQTPIGGWNYAAGGKTPTGLGYLRSAEDGMADRIPATIDNRQPAKLSGGEFVIPADVVSHLGNGNSDAGAKQLHDFMARIRKARTGNQAQGKRIDPAKFFPKGRG